MKVELDLSNYVTKADLKKQQVSMHWILLTKTDLANLKNNLDRLDIDKLKNVPTNISNLKSKVDKLNVDKLVPDSVDLSKLSNVVKNGAVKKDVYNAKIKNIEDKIPDITNLATNTTVNAKINDAKNEIPSVTNLVSNASLNAKINDVLNRILSITNLATNIAPYCC